MFFEFVQAYVDNPLEDQGVLDTLTTYLNGIIIAVVPFVIIAVIVVGLIYIASRGNSTSIADNHKLFIKIAIYAAGVLGLVVIFNIVVDFLMKIYNAI